MTPTFLGWYIHSPSIAAIEASDGSRLPDVGKRFRKSVSLEPLLSAWPLLCQAFILGILGPPSRSSCCPGVPWPANRDRFNTQNTVCRQSRLRRRRPNSGERTGHTMREVAKRAGVCPATVSRVLNKTHYISAETERRVLDVVGQLKYFKNVHARRLATGQSDLFGLVISEIANPYFPEVIRGFQAAAWDPGFDVLLCNTQYDQARTRSILRKLIESNVRGVAIMTASIDKSMTSDLMAAGIGVVFCNLSPPEKLVSTISIDYQRGISQAIDHVVQLGHRRPAVVAGPDDNHTAATIKDGLLAGLKERGLTPSPVLSSNYRIDAGASAVKAILSMAERPTVIFCGSDLIAMGAMSALEEAGVEVPDEISVVGIEDISFACLARPPLPPFGYRASASAQLPSRRLIRCCNCGGARAATITLRPS
jgi:DNA-binding LacI/PurR family transcriptional regulator